MTAAKQDTRRVAVARRVVDVQRSLSAFTYGDDQFPSPTVMKAMRECEAAFSDDDFDRAEHLANVTAFLIAREAPKFATDPEKWIKRVQELRP
jgi:hypothetical protein